MKWLKTLILSVAKWSNKIYTGLNGMSTSAAIVIAALVLGLCHLGTGLYKIVRLDNYNYVRINTLTGSVESCNSHYRC